MQTKAPRLAPRGRIFFLTLRNLGFGLVLIALALSGGMLGYHHLDNLSWIDSFLESSMILAGMGPVATLHTFAAKLFAGCYALFSGLFFILLVGLVFAPVVQHNFKKWHIEVSR